MPQIEIINLDLRDDFAASYRPEGYKLKDFSIVRDDDGLFHVYYIKTPWAVPNDYVYGLENMIGHSTTRDFIEWQTHDPVLVAIQGTWEWRCIIAPYVLRHDGRWWMFYAGTGHRSRIGIATSTDLFNWMRHPINPVYDPSILPWPASGGGGCRDPHVSKFDDGFYLYTTIDSADGRACVGVAHSTDLLQWRDRGQALVAPRDYGGKNMSSSESAAVHAIDGRYLMMVKQYHAQGKCRHGTFLIWSDDPTRFDWEKRFLWLDRAISMELVSRRGNDFLFACFSCVYWRFHVIRLTLRDARFEVAENLTPREITSLID